MKTTTVLLLLASFIATLSSAYANELLCPSDYVVIKSDGNGGSTAGANDEEDNLKRGRKLQTPEEAPTTVAKNPIEIIRQGGDFVEFHVHNSTWFDDENASGLLPQHIFTSYVSGTFASVHCVLDENMDPLHPTNVMKASCMDTPKAGNVTIVRTFVRYNVNVATSTSAATNVAIPKCCEDPYVSESAANNYKVVEYVFEVRCDVSCDNPEKYSDHTVVDSESHTPTSAETASPTTKSPTSYPTVTKSAAPTDATTIAPTVTKSAVPTDVMTIAPTLTSDTPSAYPTVNLFIETDAPTVPVTKAATCPVTKPISSLSRDLVVGSQLNGPHYGSRHPWAWPQAKNRSCSRYVTAKSGFNAWPCYVTQDMFDRVLSFDSAYMNFQFSFDKGMTSTISLSNEAKAGSKGPSIISFYPSGGGASTPCSKPDGTWSDYPIRLVRSGRYLHHWYFEKINCNGSAGDTRVELKVTPDCVEVYSVSNTGANTMNWLDSSTKDKLSSSTNGFAGISYCVRCDSELNGSSSGNDEELSGCEIVQTPIQIDCCPLTPTTSDSSLCGTGWTYDTCGASKALTTELTKDVTLTTNQNYPIKGSGHSFEISLPRLGRNPVNTDSYAFDINNNSNTWKKVKLNFNIAKPIRITGVTGILVDANTQEPTGIHVQMSKNWHSSKPGLYNGYWWTGVAHVRVPPGKTSLQLVIAFQYYKGLHCVSHSQLSLVGWGVNGLWEEVGLGSNGESITYEPHGHHRRQMILDTRPWLVCGMGKSECVGTPDKTQWTGNVGGGDFLNAVDKRGVYQYLVRDTTYHTMNGPRLTNATYAGTTNDQNIAVSRTVSTWTADDFVRHLHSFQYTFLKDTAGDNYPRFAMYILGGDNYNYVRLPMFAYGMGENMNAGQGGDSAVVPIQDVIAGFEDTRYTNYYQVDAPIGCSQGGDDNGSCWFAMMTNPSNDDDLRGNRGIIVRNFHGRLNGEVWPPPDRDVSPFAFHLVKSRSINSSKDTVSIELALPSEFKAAVSAGEARFIAGDYLTADVELLIPPRQSKDYFGKSQVLKTWLTEAEVDADYSNGWKVIAREASAGDAIRPRAFVGSLERQYPPRVHVDCATDEALFNIAIPDAIPGILPITIAGVSASKTFSENLLDRPSGKLWRYVGSSWKEMGTNGNYQLEKDVADNSYTYVYSLRLEFEPDPVGNCEQFAFGASPPLVANPPCA